MNDMNSTRPISLYNNNPMNGFFENRPKEALHENEGEELKKLLFTPFKKYGYNEKRNYLGSIEIHSISNSKIKVSCTDENNFISTRILKGEIHNGFFLVKRKLKAIGIPGIVYIYRERRIMLGINDEGDLIVKTGEYDFGNVFLFIGGGIDVVRYTYPKVNLSN